MRELDSTWRRALAAPGSRKVILATIVVGRDFRRAFRGHPARIPGALRYATASNVTAVSEEDGGTFPFWPFIARWPDIEYVLAPEQRRAEIPAIALNLLANAEFDERFLMPTRGGPAAFLRVDLWTDGVPLERTIPLLVGGITDTRRSGIDGAVTLEATDGDALTGRQFPPGNLVLTRDDFPDAADDVIGRARRQFIYGPFPFDVLCTPIDGLTGTIRRLYLCDHALDGLPTQARIGGEIYRGPYALNAITRHSPSSGSPYTEISFGDPNNPIPISELGYSGVVTVSGGVGISNRNAVMALMEDYAGYVMSREAKSILSNLNFNLNILLNSPANVLDIVTRRILPQTDMVGTFRGGEFQIYRLLSQSPSRSMSPGDGLRDFVRDGDSETSINDVHNVIEVRYGRVAGSGALNPFAPVVISKSSGGRIGRLLGASQSMYGPRTLALQASDLGTDASGRPVGPTRLGELVAQLCAFVHRKFTYDAEWLDGMEVDLNWLVRLTDPANSLSGTKTRVVKKRILPTGPRITFQTEDAL